MNPPWYNFQQICTEFDRLHGNKFSYESVNGFVTWNVIVWALSHEDTKKSVKLELEKRNQEQWLADLKDYEFLFQHTEYKEVLIGFLEAKIANINIGLLSGLPNFLKYGANSDNGFVDYFVYQKDLTTFDLMPDKKDPLGNPITDFKINFENFIIPSEVQIYKFFNPNGQITLNFENALFINGGVSASESNLSLNFHNALCAYAVGPGDCSDLRDFHLLQCEIIKLDLRFQIPPGHIYIEISDILKCFTLSTGEPNRRISFKNVRFHPEFMPDSFPEEIFYDLDFSEVTIYQKESIPFQRKTIFHGDFIYGALNKAIFPKAEFYKKAIFANAILQEKADFSGVQFHDECNFQKAVFEQEADFSGAVFHHRVLFSQAEFKAPAFFPDTQFLCKDITEAGHPEYASPSFVGADFQTIASFRRATFKAPPHFENVKGDAIRFEEKGEQRFYNHPDKDLTLAASAWASLMRIADRMHDHKMRHCFHKLLLEVEEKMVTEKSHRFFYAFHKILGGGRSTLQPLAILLFITTLSFYFYSFLFDRTHMLADIARDREEKAKIERLLCPDYLLKDTTRPYEKLEQVSGAALELTVAHTIPLFMLHPTDPKCLLLPLETNPTPFPLFGTRIVRLLHSLLSIICLFYVGLSLRNRFHLKS